MIAIRKIAAALRSDQRGATAVEYGLIVALIIIAMMGGLASLGGGADGMWSNLQAAVEAAML